MCTKERDCGTIVILCSFTVVYSHLRSFSLFVFLGSRYQTTIKINNKLLLLLAPGRNFLHSECIRASFFTFQPCMRSNRWGAPCHCPCGQISIVKHLDMSVSSTDDTHRLSSGGVLNTIGSLSMRPDLRENWKILLPRINCKEKAYNLPESRKRLIPKIFRIRRGDKPGVS